MVFLKSPLKVWLMLSLLVLLVHLSLLQTLPLGLNELTPQSPVMRFATRSLPPEPVAVVVPKPSPKPMPAAPTTTLPLPRAMTPPTVATEAGAPIQPDEVPKPTSDEHAVGAQSMPQAAASQVALASPPVSESTLKFQTEALPGSIKLIYNVQSNKFPYSLKSELVWRLEDQNYQASLSFSAFGQTRIQTSRGAIGASGLAPLRFSDKYRSEVAAHFNWEQGRVTFSANTPDAALAKGAQDRLSVLIQLAALVASAPERFSAGSTLSIQTVGPRDASAWLFAVGEIETLSLAGRNIQGLKLTRKSRESYDQQVEIWLSPSLVYLPARIRITETNGDYIDQQWESSEPVGPLN
jgi:hypothetical protein